MAPSEFNLKECGFYRGPVPNGATVTIDCPPGQVIGRYLVVQLSGSNYLTLCEVSVVAELGMLIYLHPPISRFMGPTWGAPGADRTPVGPMLAPWTLLSGSFLALVYEGFSSWDGSLGKYNECYKASALDWWWCRSSLCAVQGSFCALTGPMRDDDTLNFVSRCLGPCMYLTVHKTEPKI